MGQKSFDNETMPLCLRCHKEFHDGTGWAEWETREDRRSWQTYQVQRCQHLYIELGFAHEVPQAPGTCQDSPLLVEALHSDKR